MNKRNVGIELLRCMSMMLAVLLHVLNAGGIMDGTDYTTWYAKIALAMFVVAFCGVDCFALISGYVGWNSKLKPSRIILLWLQVFFYSVIITGIFAVVRPEIVNGQIWRSSLLPVISEEYWYITQYFGLLILIPFLNYGLQSLSQRALQVMICISFVLGITLPCLLQYTPFGIFGGYSAIWLALLYIVGGYIARFGVAEKIKIWHACLLFFVSFFITFMGCRRDYSRLLDYASPTIVLCAIALLIFCVKLNIKGDSALAKFILLVSPSALSVFLIHIHPVICDNYIIACAVWILKYSLPLFVLFIILMVLGIFFGCVIADIPRRIIWKRLKKAEFLAKIDGIFTSASEREDAALSE